MTVSGDAINQTPVVSGLHPCTRFPRGLLNVRAVSAIQSFRGLLDPQPSQSRGEGLGVPHGSCGAHARLIPSASCLTSRDS